MNSINQRLHIRIAMGVLLGIERPIPHIVLPSIVERDPNESQALDRRERIEQLLRLHRPSVAPRAPDRAKRVIRRRGHLETWFHHGAPEVGQSAEVITLMDG